MSGTQCQRNINHDTDPDEIIRILTLWSPLENKFAIRVQILVLTGRKALRSHYHRETWFLSALLIPTPFTKEVAKELRTGCSGPPKASLPWVSPRHSPADCPPPHHQHSRDTRHFKEETQIIWQSIHHTGTACVRVCVHVCLCVTTVTDGVSSTCQLYSAAMHRRPSWKKEFAMYVKPPVEWSFTYYSLL